MYTFAVNLAGPLFASYMLSDLKFSYMTFTAVVSCEYIARIISLTFWGRHVDKSGSLSILSQVSYFIPFIPILWLFSSNYFYLCGVQMLSGTVWAAFDLSVQTFIYKATPPDQRLRYIVYHRSLTSLSVALGAITGAFMLNHMFSIFGSQILGMFLVSALLRLVIARLMLPRLTLQGIPDAVVHPELEAELATVPAAVRMGLYYYPDLWRRFTRRATSVGSNIIGRAVSTIAPQQNGLFYKPAKWAEYLRGASLQPAMAEIKDTTPPVRDGLFYHREHWANYQKQPIINNSIKAGKQSAGRNGLFHNPQNWGDYLKQSLVLNAATMRTANEGLTLRQPVFYHPEIWEKYQKETATHKVRTREKTSVSREALLYHPDEWQKYGAQSTTRKNRKVSPQIGTTIATMVRIPKYVKPQIAVKRTTGITAPATATRPIHEVSKTSALRIRTSTALA
jgi:hypothetical protein